MAVKYLVLMVLMFGTVWAQTDQQISNTLDNLPTEFKGKVNESEIALVKNKTEAVFKEKCDKNGGPGAFEKAQKAYEVFPQCVKDGIGLDDPAVLKNEIENAKPTGTVDEVFKKYCAKSPEAMKCFKNMSETVGPCFNAEEKKNLKVVHNLTEQLAEFICYKDGDRIALFIAEGGPDCFETKQEEIQQCVKENLGVEYDFDSSNISANSIPQIAFGEKECAKFRQLQKCFVGALEKCQAPTSANIVESLFKFAFKATPCKPEKEVKGMEARTNTNKNETKPNAASGLAVASTTFLVALVSTRLF